MRRYLLVLPFVVACAKTETPSADSAAAAMPAAITEADVAGNWSGNVMMEASDSVLFTWTETCGSGTCRAVFSNAPKDTVVITYVIAGDSLTYTAGPNKDPQSGAMVNDAGVARPTGNQVTGSGKITLAAKADSVIMRYRFTGTRQP
jgi:hypothetical protein